MSHFAKIENDLVVEVIVAEQEFVDTLDGEWVQTSYNTHGGVHYNPDTQEPSADQSRALRKNYAGIGYSYNRELDAFIAPKPDDNFELNTSTCLWEQI